MARKGGKFERAVLAIFALQRAKFSERQKQNFSRRYRAAKFTLLCRACLKFEKRGKNDKAQFFNYIEDAFNVVAIYFLIFFRFGVFKKTARKKR